jgi:acetyl-CoA synthetase
MTKELIQAQSVNPHIRDFDEYKKLYDESIKNPQGFFKKIARENLSWIKDFNEVHNNEFAETKWFYDGKINVSENCIDRHLENDSEKVALIWEGDEPGDSKKYTFKELHEEVCKFANVLKDLKVSKGSRVCIYMPMIPEAAFAMLACTRIGAIHSVVFGGFSPESLKDRILDADCEIVITADEGIRGGKKVPLKLNVDEALRKCPNVKHTVVIKRSGGEVPWNEDRDLHYEILLKMHLHHVIQNQWMQKILCLFYIPQVLLENQKESFIQLQVICLVLT